MENTLKGIKILITAGPTREMWDSIRYLSNLSSGKTGLAIAEKAVEYGADVRIVTAIKNHGISCDKNVYAESAEDMFKVVKEEINECEIFISAAAVADFRPVKSMSKIKKEENLPVIKLERNPDILKWVGANYSDKLIVGFSLDDKIDVEKGIAKLTSKKCDIMVINDIGNLGEETKSFVLATSKGIERHESLSLKEMAEVILKQCPKLL